jgi:lysozyme
MKNYWLIRALIFVTLLVYSPMSSFSKNTVDIAKVLIKEFEGIRLIAYECPSGIPTIGIGSTHYKNGDPVKIGDSINIKKANELYKIHANEIKERLNQLITIELNTYQESALISFIYNVGYGNFRKSKLLKMINNNPDDIKIRNEFLRWTKSKGKELKGLIDRRSKESNLYFTNKKQNRIMAVEIYLEPELAEMVGNPEVTEEWKQLAVELGMTGQLKLIEPKSEGESEKNPSPYIHMNKKFERIFAILCPEVVDYKKYDKSTIPREALKEIALAEKEQYFDKICIWYDDASPDPLVVGYIKDGSYQFIKHMIVRFGDELLPFEELEVKATNRLMKYASETLQNKLDGIKSSVHDFFNPKSGYSSGENMTIEIASVSYNHRHGS